MIDRYGFNVELIVQTSTSMHGSSEGHTGYIYRRVEPSIKASQQEVNGEGDEENKENRKMSSSRKQGKKNKRSNRDEKDKDCRILLEGGVLSDPLFVNAWKSTRQDLTTLMNDVRSEVLKNLSSSRPTRKRKSVSLSL